MLQNDLLLRAARGETTEPVLNVSALPTGLYMLEVRLGTQRIVQKVVKQ